MSPAYLLARGGSTLARWIPRPARHALGFAAGAGSYLGWRSKRLVTQQNMAQVTGRSTHDPYVQHLAFASWRNYGRYAADFMNFPNLDTSEIERAVRDVTPGVSSWLEHVELALKPGRGAIFATAHFGNWDIAGAFAAHHVPLSAVAETFSDQRLNTLLQNQRKEKGLNIIPMEGSARRILRVLQQNQVVAIVVDRPVAPDEGIPVTFFGRTTYVPGGPAALALKGGAAIIPGYVWYGLHNEFYLRTFPPIFPQASTGRRPSRQRRPVFASDAARNAAQSQLRSVGRMPTGNDAQPVGAEASSGREEPASASHAGGMQGEGDERANEVIRSTQLIYDALEEMVRSWPTQWYMFRQFWPSS